MENRLIFLTGIFSAFILFTGTGCKTNLEEKGGNDTVFKDMSAVKVEYLAHASFILEHNNYNILIDPFADTTWIGYSFPKNIKVDAIFSTHPHYDHDGGIFRDLKPYWQGKFPLYKDPGNYSMGGFKITGLKGKHCDPYGKEFDQKNTIFIFEVANIKIAHWGDNGPVTDSLEMGLQGIDILMLPIDDSYHILQAEEIDEIIVRVNPKVVIPMHYKIPELEAIPGRPKNLESIEMYFKDMDNVKRLEDNVFTFDKANISETLTYMIFQHSESINN